MTQLLRDEVLRYQRHLTLPNFGEAAQLKLKASRVLVIGAGGLGCPVLQYLAAAGVGNIGIVDDDVVSFSNLQRQILFNESDVGRSKADLAAQKLKALNSSINCTPYPTRLSIENAEELIGAYDVVVDGTDNFPSRYLINDACILTGRPLVYGALYTFQGQASVFNYQNGPTYRCLFPEPPRPEDAPNCSEIGVVGVLPGLIGMIQATEVVKIITGVGEVLSGRLMIWDALSMRQQIVNFQRVPEQANIAELKLIDYTCGLKERKSSVVEVDPLDLQKDETDYQVIDVREDWERLICQLPSVHVPMATILEGTANFQALGLSIDKPTYVYCKAGLRSLKSAEMMQAHYGFKQLKSLKGGILRWADDIDSSLERY